MPREPASRRWIDYALLAALGLLVVSPALSRTPKDDYPLSTYPMFASQKNRSTTVDHLVAVGPSGDTILAPRYVGTDEVLQARATISRAVRGGEKSRTELCAQVAQRVAADSALATTTHVELRTVTYDSIDYFTKPNQAPQKRVLRARCEVKR